MLSRWVAQEDCKASAGCLERPGTNQAHVHMALLYKSLTTQQHVFKRLKTLFAEEIKNDPRWEWVTVAMVCKAHPNFVELAGGYYTKEVDCRQLWCVGVSVDELQAGKDQYEKHLANAQKRRCVPGNLIPHLLEIYDEYQELNEMNKEPQPDVGPQECLDQLIRRGYVNYLLHWPKIKRTVTENWIALVTSVRPDCQ